MTTQARRFSTGVCHNTDIAEDRKHNLNAVTQ